jgi:ankyrin repeat protein
MRRLAALVFAWTSCLAFAQECRVPPANLPDADELMRVEEARRKLDLATRALSFRFDRPERKKSLAAPPKGPGPEVMLVMGRVVRLPVQEIEVKDGDEVVRMRVLPGTTEDQALAGLRRERARKASQPPLASAIEASDLEEIQRLLRAGARVDSPEKNSAGKPRGWVARAAGGWALREYEARGDLEREREVAVRHVAIIEALLAAGSDPTDKDGDSSAIASIPYRMSDGEKTPGAFEIARRLLQAGDPLDKRVGADEGPLDRAARRDDAELLNWMLRYGRPSQASKDSGLRNAFAAGSWDSALALLASGADPNQTSGPGSTARLLDAAMNGPRRVVKAMIAHKADLTVAVSGGLTPLILAMHDHELMKDLLEGGADANARTAPEGMSVLHYAVYSGWPSDVDVERYPAVRGGRRASAETRAQSVALLLQHGARADVADAKGRTPIELTSPDDVRIIGSLIIAGSVQTKGGILGALELRNETLATAIAKRRPDLARSDCALVYHAASAGAVTTLEALLAAGASASTNREGDRFTPLMVAASAGHASAVRLLLDKGAIIDHQIEFRATKEEEAQARALLEKLGASQAQAESMIIEDRKRRSGTSALMLAARSGREEVVRLLLERGANAALKDGRERTALDYAKGSRAPSAPAVVRLLTR